MDGGFGDAIHVHQLRASVGMRSHPASQPCRVQCFSTEDHKSQGQSYCLMLCSYSLLQGIESRRRLVEDSYLLSRQQSHEFSRRAADPIRDNDQPPSIEQSAPDFPDRKIESHRVEECPRVLLSEGVVWPGGGKEASYLPVTDANAFGLAS